MISPAETTARSITCSLNVRIAWWLRPYLGMLAVICEVTGIEPNMERVKRMIDKGVTVEAIPVAGTWRPVMHAFVRLAGVTTIAIVSGTAAIAFPAHAWTLGWFAGLIDGWVVHPWIADSIAARRTRKANK